MISQLRIYAINRGKLDDFVEGWKKFVYPLPAQYIAKTERCLIDPVRWGSRATPTTWSYSRIPMGSWKPNCWSHKPGGS